MESFSAHQKAQVRTFHLTSALIGFVVFLLTFWLVPHSSFSLVSNTLTVLKVVIVVFCFLNVLGFWKVASALRSSDSQILPKSKLFSFITFPLAILASVTVAHVGIVLFGAPFVAKMSHTFHMACLLTTTSAIPLLVTYQRNWDDWLKIIFIIKRLNILEWNMLVCLVLPIVGCWIGAVFIPLDWDRPWQAWPITCAVGTILGYAIGHGIAVGRLCYAERQQQGNKRKVV